jgi:predicted dehydrogenase
MKAMCYLALLTLSGCALQSRSPTIEPPNGYPMWKPIGDRKAKVVLWGIVHNHARGKFDALLKLTNDYEVIGWVDDTASTAMRMAEPKPQNYARWPKLDGGMILSGEIRPDLVVVECSNAELVETSTKIAMAGYPMHMDKPLGTDQAGFRKMSRICEARGIPLQIGYMFRSNEAINTMVGLAKGGVIGDVYAIDADLDHNYGYPKYPAYAGGYPGGTAYLLACHVIEWAMPIFDDVMPTKTYSIIKPAPGDPEGCPTHTLTIMEWPRANATIRVCSKGTQPCRHIRIDGTDGCMEMEPIEDFRTVKHTTGLNEGLACVDKLTIKLFLKKDKPPYKAGVNRIEFKAPDDRYAGQLHELARILRGEIPNPPRLYEHDLKVHKVSLEACNLPTEDVK